MTEQIEGRLVPDGRDIDGRTAQLERVHLFSAAGSLRTLSAMAGAPVAVLVPLLFIDDIGKVDAYRFATYGGLSLWFISLIPALMLRSIDS